MSIDKTLIQAYRAFHLQYFQHRLGEFHSFIFTAGLIQNQPILELENLN